MATPQQYRDDIRHLQQRLQSLQKAENGLKKTISVKDAELATLRDQVSALESRQANVSKVAGTKNAELLAELTSLKGNVTALKSQIAKLQRVRKRGSK